MAGGRAQRRLGPPTPPAGGSRPAVPGVAPPEDGARGPQLGREKAVPDLLPPRFAKGNAVRLLNGAGGGSGRSRARGAPPERRMPLLAAPRGGTAASPGRWAQAVAVRGCSRRGTAKQCERCAVPRDKATAEVYTEQQ